MRLFFLFRNLQTSQKCNESIFQLTEKLSLWMRWPLTYRWYVGCTHNEQETPALPWLGEHVGLGKVLHEAVPVIDSNEASLELERCQSSTGLQVKMNHRHTRQTRFSPFNLHA